MRKSWIIVFALLVTLLLVASPVMAFNWWPWSTSSTKQSTQVSKQKQQPATGTLTLKVTEKYRSVAATIYINGKNYGTTPKSITLNTGCYDIKLVYKSIQQSKYGCVSQGKTSTYTLDIDGQNTMWR